MGRIGLNLYITNKQKGTRFQFFHPLTVRVPISKVFLAAHFSCKPPTLKQYFLKFCLLASFGTLKTSENGSIMNTLFCWHLKNIVRKLL